MILLIFSEPVYQYWFVRQPRDYSKEKHRLDSLVAKMEWRQDSLPSKTEIKVMKLFSFDPNQTTIDEFTRLGFSQTLANRIINYRAKGGRFVTKKDLRKIYGMDSVFYQKISPYIVIPETLSKSKETPKFVAKEKLVAIKFDLNTADTSQLIKIYGVGPKLAHRIIAYRQKLGGFVFGNQLKEIYGLDSLVVMELQRRSYIHEAFQPKQLNINTAAERELASHPYIKYKFAKAIVAYRMQHGAFTSMDDLKKIAIIGETDFQRMKPYTVVQ